MLHHSLCSNLNARVKINSLLTDRLLLFDKRLTVFGFELKVGADKQSVMLLFVYHV